MVKKTLLAVLGSFLVLSILMVSIFPTSVVLATGATNSTHIVKYAEDGVTVLADRMISCQWMEANLPVYGDGVTHYYMQGPTFDANNLWDPNETVSLKDKGAVMGTDIKDLCNLVGGMDSGDEVLLCAVDNWQIKFKFANVYEPQDRQGIIALCWYKAGEGYPGNDAYNEALQIVIMARTQNAEGQYVFGNADMQAVMPLEEGYSHFYDGLWPSTNGLSGKWINRIVIYPSGSSPDIPDSGTDTTDTNSSSNPPWIPIGLGIAGLLLVGTAVYFVTRKKDVLSPPTGGV